MTERGKCTLTPKKCSFSLSHILAFSYRSGMKIVSVILLQNQKHVPYVNFGWISLMEVLRMACYIVKMQKNIIMFLCISVTGKKP